MKFFSKLFSISLIFFFTTTLSFAEEQLIIEPEMGRTPIISTLQNAKSTINLVMYGLTDSQIINALTSAKSNGKNIQVILEYHPYKSHGENTHSIQQLKKSGIELAKPNLNFQLIHQKTLLTDHNQALIMTFNFTHSSFKNQRNFALLITDPAEIQEIQQVFDADWQQKRIAVKNLYLVWSPDNSREKIIELIKSAHDNIKIYAQSLTDYQMLGALANAARTGVKVKILLTENNLKHKRKLAYLTQAGVEVHFSNKYVIHAKVIIVDNKSALLGSVNFTKPSIDYNRELSIITQSPAIISKLNQIFDNDFLFQ